jgi:iron(III) transport system ATP-binding protein
VTLYRRPGDAPLARFVGEAILLPGVAAGGHVTCVLGRLRLPAGGPDGPVQVLVRPEQIQLGSGTQAGVRARVCGVTFYGHDASVNLLLAGDGQPQCVVARVAGYASPEPGKEVTLSVRGDVVAFSI